MKAMIRCTGCGVTLQVPAGVLGKQVRCPKCRAVFRAAAPEEEEVIPYANLVAPGPPPRPARGPEPSLASPVKRLLVLILCVSVGGLVLGLGALGTYYWSRVPPDWFAKGTVVRKEPAPGHPAKADDEPPVFGKLPPAKAAPQPAGTSFEVPVVESDFEFPPFPPEARQKRLEERLAYNRRTLADAYEKVGKKDPHWDEAAREALELAARMFSGQAEPPVVFQDIHPAARRAVDAGCDDALILYLYALTSDGVPVEEYRRRHLASGTAMTLSGYPYLRRAVALHRAASARLMVRPGPDDDERREAAAMLDLACTFLAQAAAEEPDGRWLRDGLTSTAEDIYRAYQSTGRDLAAHVARMSALLSREPRTRGALATLRGHFLIGHAWEARGTGVANTVTEQGWKLFRERLDQARASLEEACKLQPDGPRAPTLMLVVLKAQGADVEEVRPWFRRAIKADPDNLDACQELLDYLDPKWHGSVEELVAFGRACRDTKNWRSRIPLLIADAHYRATPYLPEDAGDRYLASDPVWSEIKAAYDEFFARHPKFPAEQSRYAMFCYAAGRLDLARQEFQALGGQVVPAGPFPVSHVVQVRDYLLRSSPARPAAPAKDSAGKGGSGQPRE